VFKLVITTLLSIVFLAANATPNQKILKNINYVQLNNNDDYSDLTAYGDAVGDKRIIFLNELSHGEEEVFALKSRLVRYLHQEKGFDVLLLESSLFDVNEIWQNRQKTLAQQAAGNIFYMYANNGNVQTLLNYVESKRTSKTPLYLSGFDGRLLGESSANGVVDFIAHGSKQFLGDGLLAFSWKHYIKQAQKLFSTNQVIPDEKEQEFFIEQSYELQDHLLKTQSEFKAFESPKYIALLVKGLLFKAEELWGSRRHDEQDIPMADNVKWLLDEVYPNKKIIVWGHYIHLNRNGAEINRYANLGTLMTQRWPNNIYITNITAGKGSYREFRDLSVLTIPTLRDSSIEKQLLDFLPKKEKSVSLFIDESDLDFSQLTDKTMFGHEYKYQIPVPQWKNHWDGLFFINKVSAAN